VSRSRGIGGSIAAVVALLALAASTAVAATAPATPAGRQLAWVIGALNGSRAPSQAELEQHFSASFLAAVPPQRLVAALVPVWSERPLQLTSVLAQQGQLALQARLDSPAGASFRVAIQVSAAPPNAIEGLVFTPLAAPTSSWAGVDAALKRLAAHASLYAASANGSVVHALAARRVGAIGSAFKLYVLGALATAIADGKASWTQQLTIRNAWKSLPSGAMRNQPAGRRFTLRHYAEQMISVSDNTAADHLIGRLGRRAVEAQLRALANSAPARNEPFLTTRELFALKLAAPAPLRNAFEHADSAGRRRLLPRIDALDPTLAEAAGWKNPRAIGSLEWFASPRDLAHALTTLLTDARSPRLAPLRAILATNPGIQLDRSSWHYIAFKGGSEPGVISLTLYLQRRDGHAFVLSIILNDEHKTIDDLAAVSAAQAAIALLAHS
jgi:beta-lactamase class A